MAGSLILSSLFCIPSPTIWKWRHRRTSTDIAAHSSFLVKHCLLFSKTMKGRLWLEYVHSSLYNNIWVISAQPLLLNNYVLVDSIMYLYSEFYLCSLTPFLPFIALSLSWQVFFLTSICSMRFSCPSVGRMLFNEQEQLICDYTTE